MPDLTDDIVEIPVDSSAVDCDGNPVTKDDSMAATIDALVEKLVDQNYTKTFARMDQYGEHFVAQSTLVNTAMAQLFGMAVQIVNATALNRIPSGTANQILEHNASAGQPYNSPAAPKAGP